MDERWRTRVQARLPALVQVLDPMALHDRLYAASLVSKEEYDWLCDRSTSREDKSRRLLVDILPRKGRTSYEKFVSLIGQTEGQSHIISAILQPDTKTKGVPTKAAIDVGGYDNERARACAREKVHISMKMKMKELEASLAQLRMTVLGLRNKIGWDCGQWERMTPSIPAFDSCFPLGCVAEIDGIIHVGWEDTMYWLKNGQWRSRILGFMIGSVFECDGKGYVMDVGRACPLVWGECRKIYEWKNETTKLVTQIDGQYQMKYRSAIGHKEKIYLVGGKEENEACDSIDCFDVAKREWEETRLNMKKSRKWCSLAVVDDKLFFGGGKGSNEVECLSIGEEKWIQVGATTEENCRLSSWNGKIVATGGGRGSRRVEMYDERSGTWLPLPSMNHARVNHGACSTKDNRLVVVGGGASLEKLCIDYAY
ncbi:uncharacterized protein [Oscarella lobularis]|uniref:uncharacterized protein isoform X2 n=1 Tax=Oscarella lobularis TaxID=121494 RepID=UPI003313B81E